MNLEAKLAGSGSGGGAYSGDLSAGEDRRAAVRAQDLVEVVDARWAGEDGEIELVFR